MGGSKAKKAPPKKEKKKLQVVFDCPLCDGAKTITIKIKKTTKTATLKCRNCRRADYDTHTTNLSREIDVFTEWYSKLLPSQPAQMGAAPGGPAPGGQPATGGGILDVRSVTQLQQTATLGGTILGDDEIMPSPGLGGDGGEGEGSLEDE